MKKHNFSAGPSILPQSVIKEASNGVLNINNTHLSILEISHRSDTFQEIIDETEALVRELMDVPDAYAVLFLSGGASSQFFMTAMNLLGKEEKAYYVDTGTWSTKAIKEALGFGTAEVLASSEDKKYSYIPKNIDVPNDGVYLHITSNNTIYGTQYHQYPESTIPVIADMSSDIFSKPIDVNKFGIIYAGAQKNLGPAGVTLAIVKKALLGKVNRNLPTMLDYRTHIKKQSMFNTPPAFPIYVSMLTLRWLKTNGGLGAIEAKNIEKANLLYQEIDRNSLFEGVARKEDRSLMNVTFIPTREDLLEPFVNFATNADCVGIKGHRSAGGFRASIYNAMQKESVVHLVNLMKEFEAVHA